MLSKRWEVILFLFVGAVIAYTLRVNMSVCAQKMKDDLDWTETEKGYVLSAFFWGYSAGQIPASLAAEKFGSKTTFGFAILAPSILTLLVPWAAKTSLACLLAIRALIGLAAAATFPSIYHFYPRWVPPLEKTKMVTYSHSGMYVGEVVGFALSGALVNKSIHIFGSHVNGWEMGFYLFGLFGMIYFPIYWWRIYDTPEEHPYITQDEIKLIRTPLNAYDDNYTDANEPLISSHADDENGHGRRQHSSSTPAHAAVLRQRHRSRSSSFIEALGEGMTDPTLEGGIPEDTDPSTLPSHSPGPAVRRFAVNEIPWGVIFTHPVSLTLFMNMFTYGWIGYVMLTEIPSFLTDVLGYDLEDAGYLSVIPYIANFLSVMVFGWIFDYLQVNKGWSVRDVRQWAMRVAFIGAGCFLIAMGFIKIPGVAFTCMVLALWFFGALQAGISCAYLDASPNFSTTMNTIGNMLGAVAGVVAPIIVALFITTWEGRKGWQTAFFLTAAMCAVSLIFWKLNITSEIVPELNTPVVVKKEEERIDSLDIKRGRP
jgi:MFS family permease